MLDIKSHVSMDTFHTEASPRSSQYRPSVPTKPLFWQRLQTVPSSSVWHGLSVPDLADLPEFVHLFAKRGKPERSSGLLEDCFAPPPPQARAPRPATLLDPKRSQAVAILLRSIHLRMEDICEAVVTLDSSLVDVESIRALRDNVRMGREEEKRRKRGGEGRMIDIVRKIRALRDNVRRGMEEGGRKGGGEEEEEWRGREDDRYCRKNYGKCLCLLCVYDGAQYVTLTRARSPVRSRVET